MQKSGQFVVCLLFLRWACAGAETPISIRLEPKPDHTIQVTTTLSLSMSLKAGGTGSETGGPRMATEAVLGYKQANGRFDEQGRMESQLTIERFEMKQSLNGTTRSLDNIEQVLGRSLTAVFDRGGRLVDLTVPKDLQQTSSVLKQMVASAYSAINFLPAPAMAVGETKAGPSSIPMRLPGSKTPLPYQTRTMTTLRSVEKRSGDRVAHFEQRIESAADSDIVKVNGTGTIDVNLDRGFVAGSTAEWIFEGDGGMTGSADAGASGTVHGTIKLTVAAHE